MLIGLGVLLGPARGVHTLAQATAVTDRWGAAGYGRLNGVLTAPALVAAATAPFVGAALAHHPAPSPVRSSCWPVWRLWRPR